jgi:hypothetical protein
MSAVAQTLRTERDDFKQFKSNNKALIDKLKRDYGHSLSKDEIISELWIASLRAGTKTGTELTTYICGAVQRMSKTGMTMLTYSSGTIDKDGAEHSYDETYSGGGRWGEASLDCSDPLEILMARETAEHLINKHGQIVEQALKVNFECLGVTKQNRPRCEATTDIRREKLMAKLIATGAVQPSFRASTAQAVQVEEEDFQ